MDCVSRIAAILSLCHEIICMTFYKIPLQAEVVAIAAITIIYYKIVIFII